MSRKSILIVLGLVLILLGVAFSWSFNEIVQQGNTSQGQIARGVDNRLQIRWQNYLFGLFVSMAAAVLGVILSGLSLTMKDTSEPPSPTRAQGSL